MLYIGIDPGSSSGSISILTDKGTILTSPRGEPVQCLLKGRTDQELVNFIVSINMAAMLVKACLEQVRSMPGQGVASMFTFGQNYGLLKGILAAKYIPYIEVRPNIWQKVLNCTDPGRKPGDKSKAIKRAHERWPSMAQYIDKKNVDSLLLAEYLRLQEVGSANSN